MAFDYVDIAFDLPFTYEDDAKVDAYLDEIVEYMHARQHCCSDKDVACAGFDGRGENGRSKGSITVMEPYFEYVPEYVRWAEGHMYQNIRVEPGRY